jgi:mono/diheme cytochrome c family protein
LAASVASNLKVEMEMDRVTANTGKKTKLGLGALALAILAVPVAGAFAQGQVPGGPESQAQPEAALTAEQVEQGRQLFTDWSCGACHSLADAQGEGHVGPAFDGNANLDKAFAVDRITNGSGPMPSFGGQIADEDIALLAAYIVQVKK